MVNIEKVKPIQYNEHLCFKCLKEFENVKTYNLHERGYGSTFDGFHTKLQLCSDCDCDSLDRWFYEEPIYDDYVEEYIYEDNIRDFISTLPVQGKELFWNSCGSGWTSYSMDSQDWIDIDLGVAPDEVYKRNCMCSPSEINAYHERFPKCKHTYNKRYRDGSVGGYCKFGASGEENAVCSPNISNKCYYCNHFKLKDSEVMKVVEENTLTKADIKAVTMNEWNCKSCGATNQTYNYLDDYTCKNCGEEHFLAD